MRQASHCLTLKSKGLLRTLKSECEICEACDPALIGTSGGPTYQPFQAIWDTGATASVITQDVVDRCGLKPVGMVEVHDARGKTTAEVFMINLRLPNGVGFTNIRATKGDLTGNADALIGMDVITLGDFSITNVNRQTVFSFRVPSRHVVDYVEEENKIRRVPKFPVGGISGGRHSKSKKKKKR